VGLLDLNEKPNLAQPPLGLFNAPKVQKFAIMAWFFLKNFMGTIF